MSSRCSSDLETVLDQLNLERALLVGCSMGGGTALTFTLTHPDRVHGLVLLCPGVRGFPMPEEPELDAEYDVLAAKRDVESLVQFGLRHWAAAGSDDAVAAQLRAAVPAWFDQGEYLKPDPPVYDRLHEIQVPSVVMVGDKDRADPRSRGRRDCRADPRLRVQSGCLAPTTSRASANRSW